jgi:hypothetical protein
MAGRVLRRSWAVLFGLGGACAWLGCNALAGIQLGTLASGDGGLANGDDATTAGDATTGGDAGKTTGSDSGATDGAVRSTDGGLGADGASVTTYACAPSPSPFEVANLENVVDGGRQLDTTVVLGITQNQQARIVVQLIGQGGGPATEELFRAYDVRWQPTMLQDSVQVTTMQGAHVSNSVVTPNGITEIATQGGGFDPDSGQSTTVVEAYPLPANNQNLNQAPPPYPLTTPTLGFNQSATAIELGLEDEFVVTDPGNVLQSNRASRDGGPTMPSTFASTAPAQGGNDPTLVHVGSNVFAVYGSDPTSDAGTLIYKIPDNGVNTQPVTPGVLPPGTVIAGATQSTTDPTKIATYFATLVTTPAVQFSLYSGLVDANSFDQLQTSALNPGPSLTLHDVPANKGTSTFVGDQLVLLGLSPVSNDQGLNFVWVDTSGHVLAEAVGATRLYNQRPGIQAAAIAPANTLAGVLTTFFVAWIEERTDANGNYSVLYVDQVQCSAN